MSIFCCGRYNQSTEKIFLYSNDTYKNRYIEIVVCTNCQKKKAILHQERISDGKVIETKPKKGKVNSFIEKWSKQADKTVKTGSKNNVSWLYSKGGREKWARDFNGIKKFRVDSEVKITKF